MVQITKEEKELVEERFPYVQIKRTKKQKSNRHSYMCQEAPEVKHFLEEIRFDRIEHSDYNDPDLAPKKPEKPKRNRRRQQPNDNSDFEAFTKEFNRNNKKRKRDRIGDWNGDKKGYGRRGSK